jgi:hypothetical protein
LGLGEIGIGVVHAPLVVEELPENGELPGRGPQRGEIGILRDRVIGAFHLGELIVDDALQTDHDPLVPR